MVSATARLLVLPFFLFLPVMSCAISDAIVDVTVGQGLMEDANAPREALSTEC